MKSKLVISGFPGIGKSHFFCDNPNGYKGHLISDSDSSTFDKAHFPQNYIDHIKSLLSDENDRIILVSSHESVRKAMKDNGIEYLVIVPLYTGYTEYINRYKERGSSPEFINLMENNFDKFLDSCIDEENSYFLYSDWYLSDFLETIGIEAIKNNLR